MLQQLQRWPSVPGQCDAESQMDTEPKISQNQKNKQMEYFAQSVESVESKSL